MAMKVRTREVDGIRVVDLSGRFTIGDDGEVVRDLLRDLFAGGEKYILLNLHDVVFIDSFGIGELVWGMTSIRNRGGDLKLFSVSKWVQTSLNITKLDRVFDIHPDEEAALASVKRLRAVPEH